MNDEEMYRQLFRQESPEKVTETKAFKFSCDNCHAKFVEETLWEYDYPLEAAQRLDASWWLSPTPVFVCTSCHFFRGAWLNES